MMIESLRLIAYLDRLEATIAEHGHAVQGVFAAVDDPDPNSTLVPDSDPDPRFVPFCYTVGLTAKDRPELAIYGLDPETSTLILNNAAAHGLDRPGRVTDLLAADYPAWLVEMTQTTDLAMAWNLYGPRRLSVRGLQVVWPDKRGAFPWDRGYTIDPAAQPVHGEAPT